MDVCSPGGGGCSGRSRERSRTVGRRARAVPALCRSAPIGHFGRCGNGHGGVAGPGPCMRPPQPPPPPPPPRVLKHSDGSRVGGWVASGPVVVTPRGQWVGQNFSSPSPPVKRGPQGVTSTCHGRMHIRGKPNNSGPSPPAPPPGRRGPPQHLRGAVLCVERRADMPQGRALPVFRPVRVAHAPLSCSFLKLCAVEQGPSGGSPPPLWAKRCPLTPRPSLALFMCVRLLLGFARGRGGGAQQSSES